MTVPSFEQAWDELVTIRAAVEQGHVRVGDLAATLARARELTQVCRGHLRAAAMAVDELVDAAPASTTPGGGRPSAPPEGSRP